MDKKSWKETFKELRAKGISIVDEPFQVELMRPFILKKLGRAFEITSLTFRSNGDCLVGLLSVTPCRQYPYLHIQENATVLTTEGWARPVNFYCEELLNVEIEDEKALGFLDQEIYKVGTGIDTRFVGRDNEGVLHDLVTHEKLPKDILEGDSVIYYNGQDIGAQTCTNGQLKQKNITLVSNNLQEYDSSKVWSTVTYGASDILCDGSEVKPKDIAQANTRLSAFKAPSVPCGKIKTFAVYMGKVSFDNDNAYRDGWGFLASEFLAESLTALAPDKYFFAPWSCNGMAVQKRAWTNKILAEVVMREYITEYIAHQKFQTHILIRGMVSAEDQEQFNIGVLSKGKKGKFAGKLLIICDDPAEAWKIDLMTDLNGTKAPYDLNTESYTEVLDLSHEEHNVERGANTSTQLLQSMMIADPERAMDFIVNLGERYLQSKRDILCAEEGVAPSWADFQNDRIDYQQMLSTVYPSFAHKQYAPLWHTVVDNNIKGYVTGARRLNMPTAGAYVKIVTDPAADFGVRILGINDNVVEVLAPVAERNDYENMVGVKYPKQGFQEYLKGHNVTRKEYCDRVDSNDELTEHQKDILKKKIMATSGGIIILPAVKTLRNLLAGMDFDGDGMVLFFDEELVDIMWTIDPVAVIIDPDDVTVHDSYEEALG